MARRKKKPTTVNVHEAKTSLSKLLAEVEAGGDVVIARAGRPIARLVRYIGGPRPVGVFDHMGFHVPDDFDEPWPELEELFYK